jgi:molybdopterin molybdotransferase
MQRQSVNQVALLSCAEDRPGRSTPTAVEDVPRLVRDLVDVVEGVVPLPVARSAGWTLARDLVAAEPLPPFDQSAVDGFAFSGSPDADGAALAGDASAPLPPGGAVRVMTGAPLPFGADRVAMQERCQRSGERVFPPPLAAGANLRRRGEDVAPGDLLARAGTRLDARRVALFAALGHVMVPCLRPLRVAVLVTVDERSDPPSDAPNSGLMRDANTHMLMALLATAPDLDVQRLRCRDDAEVLIGRLRALSLEVDLIITTGGMSFGPEDPVSAAVFRLGGAFGIAGVAMKPGKPVGLARLGSAVLLGLPGNPFAALASFVVVGREVLARLRGRPAAGQVQAARSGFALDRRPGRAEFFPVRVSGRCADGGSVLERLGKGGSARLAPLVAADGLGLIGAGCVRVEVGDSLGFLPFSEALVL